MFTLSTTLRRCARLPSQQSHLSKYGRVIPIDSFAGEPVATELYNHDEIHSDRSSGWGEVGQKPGPRIAMREREVHFIDKLPYPDDSIHGCHLKVRGPRGDEDIAVEGPQSSFPVTPSVDRNVVDVGIVDHGGQSRFDVLRLELPFEMLSPQLLEPLGRENHVELGHCGFPKLAAA